MLYKKTPKKTKAFLPGEYFFIAKKRKRKKIQIIEHCFFQFYCQLLFHTLELHFPLLKVTEQSTFQ